MSEQLRERTLEELELQQAVDAYFEHIAELMNFMDSASADPFITDSEIASREEELEAKSKEIFATLLGAILKAFKARGNDESFEEFITHFISPDNAFFQHEEAVSYEVLVDEIKAEVVLLNAEQEKAEVDPKKHVSFRETLGAPELKEQITADLQAWLEADLKWRQDGTKHNLALDDVDEETARASKETLDAREEKIKKLRTLLARDLIKYLFFDANVTYEDLIEELEKEITVYVANAANGGYIYSMGKLKDEVMEGFRKIARERAMVPEYEVDNVRARVEEVLDGAFPSTVRPIVTRPELYNQPTKKPTPFL